MLIIEAYRVRADPANVARLLEVRGAAMAESASRSRSCGRPTSCAWTTSGSTSEPG
jgi:hypothetical protein